MNSGPPPVFFRRQLLLRPFLRLDDRLVCSQSAPCAGAIWSEFGRRVHRHRTALMLHLDPYRIFAFRNPSTSLIWISVIAFALLLFVEATRAFADVSFDASILVFLLVYPLSLLAMHLQVRSKGLLAVVCVFMMVGWSSFFFFSTGSTSFLTYFAYFHLLLLTGSLFCSCFWPLGLSRKQQRAITCLQRAGHLVETMDFFSTPSYVDRETNRLLEPCDVVRLAQDHLRSCAACSRASSLVEKQEV